MKPCLRCGIQFERPHKERNFCSYKCAYAYRVKTLVKKTCLVCGKEFHSLPACKTRPERKFCSWICKFVGLRKHIDKTCEYCGNKFSTKRSQRRRFCSYACFKATIHNPNRHKDRFPYYGASWNKQMHEARERDNYSCRACGKFPKNHSQLQGHHVIPFENFGRDRHVEANVLSNIVTLCISCHKFVHSGKVKCPRP